MKVKEVFEMDLKTNEKLMMIYLINKGCHLKPKKIDMEELSKALDLNIATVWRVKKVLKEAGLLRVTRANAKAIQEYEVLNPSYAK